MALLQESYNELRKKDATAMLADLRRRMVAKEDVNAPMNDQVGWAEPLCLVEGCHGVTALGSDCIAYSRLQWLPVSKAESELYCVLTFVILDPW